MNSQPPDIATRESFLALRTKNPKTPLFAKLKKNHQDSKPSSVTLKKMFCFTLINLKWLMVEGPGNPTLSVET